MPRRVAPPVTRRRRHSFAIGLLFALTFASPSLAQVSAVRSSLKVRPLDTPTGSSSITLRAAKNEFEAFQVVIAGGASGRSNVSVQAPTLVRQGGSETIPATDVRLYRERTHTFTQRSNPEGAAGEWRDALIPDVEDGAAMSSSFVETTSSEKRNAFPFSIGANRNEVVWVEVRVPPSQATGRYTGTLTVRTGTTTLGTISVTLLVQSFSLPSTSNLPTAFGMGTDNICRAHGDTFNNFCPTASQTRAWARLYARFALDHRITLDLPDASNPSDATAAANTYVAEYGGLIDGNDTFAAQRRLSGAKATTIRFPWFSSGDTTNELNFKRKLGAFVTMATGRNWLDKVYHYGKPDEPNGNCTEWATIKNQGIWAHQVNANVRVMATGNYSHANSCGTAQNDLDILNPLIQHMEVTADYADNVLPQGNRRGDYNTFLAGANNRLWMYQSCISHGCQANDSNIPRNAPNLMVDATGVQNRAEPWMHFIYNARHGMLYYNVTEMLPTAWNTDGIWSAEFGGQGDGTLFYPGTPSAIGGSTHIPVASIRLKLLREGIEDFEYLLKCEQAKGNAVAMNIATALFPNMYSASNFNADGTGRPDAVLFTNKLENARTDLLNCILPKPTLTVTLGGAGTVTSSPSGLSCSGTTCTGTFTEGTAVTLTATPASGSTFTGWSGGGCSGTGTCVVDVFSATSVTANFNAGTATLSVSRTGAGAGTVQSSPVGISCGTDCSEAYANGTQVTLTATPAANSTFGGWGGACSGTGSCVVSMTSARSVTATFLLKSFNLSVTKQGSGGGTVSSSPAGISCGADCSESYTSGTSVTLTASPNTGSTFQGWSGACTGTGSCVVSVTAATSVTATFAAVPVSLTVSRNGTGSGTVSSTPAGISCGTDCTESYNHGTQVTLTAAASSGSTFAGWAGGCSGTGSCTVSLTAATTVTATFNTAPSSATLTVQKSGTGTGTVTSSPSGIQCGTACSASYAVGTTVTLSAQPSAGSTFSGWSGGGCSGTGTCSVALNAATTVTATFTSTPSTYTLTVSKGGTGSGSVDSSPAGISCGATCSASYAANTAVTLTAAPAPGSTFGGWSGGGCSGTQSTCTVTLGANVSVSAQFNPSQPPPSGAPLFADDFNRTTGLGSNWQVLYGGFSTNGSAAVSGAPPNSGHWAFVVPSVGTDDYSVEAVLTVPAWTYFSGVVARGNASNLSFDKDLYAAQISSADGSVSLHRRNHWTWTELGRANVGVAAGSTHTLKLVVTGSNPVHLEVWVDGAMQIATEDASADRILTGLPGIQSYEENVQYDAFTVREAPLFGDSFNRTSGLGNGWSVAYGGFTTDGEAISATPPVNGDWAEITRTLPADQAIEATVLVLNDADSTGVVARSATPGFFDKDVYAAKLSYDGTLFLYRRNDWSWTLLGSAQVGAVSNQRYRLKLVVTGSSPVHVEAWLDGVKRLEVDDTSAQRLPSGSAGIVTYDPNVRFDNVTVTKP